MVRALLASVLLLALGAYASSEYDYVSYAGYKAIRATITTEEQVSVIEKMGMDVWSHDSVATMDDLTINVNPEQLAALESLDVQYHVLNHDVGASIAAEREELLHREATPLQPQFGVAINATAPAWYNSYHTAAEIFQYLQTMANSFPSLMKYTASIGTTVNNNPIPALVITGTSGNNKKKVFVQGGQHAREWVGPATVVFLIESLVANYSKNDQFGRDAKELMDTTEFYVVPLLNVDGYLFSWSSNRLWRKNRRLVSGTSTYGVDLNRNWDGANWCNLGASKTPSSDTYCGPNAFSEPETQASTRWFKANGPYAGSIDYHSYSQLMLRPWGHVNTPPADEARLKQLGDGYAAAIRSYSSRVYRSIPSFQLYYTTGTASDNWKWTSGVNSPLSYTVELRPPEGDSAGFQLPANQIAPNCAENWAAFVYFVKDIKA
eukprot:TRINITY_DN0_c0_g1_i1.p1 TRINITY_DN0_c0_g1~~TRINITY_DN0_c0_g1_i1.p1  ORF type:complete len:445 (-),score=152.65 TRINITY_DN0_c0_g1_i1:68-1372(-)